MGARGLRGPVVALTGTPGTGKSSVAAVLRARGFPVLDLARYAGDGRFDEGPDPHHHGARVLDEVALGAFLEEALADELGLAPGHDGPVFVDSHLAHELVVVDRVIVLRCRPSVLRARLEARGWPEAKVQENVEAEAIDVIVQEASEEAELAADEGVEVAVGEVDTTERSVEEVVDAVVFLASAAPANLEIGTVDWSGEVLGWY